MGGTGGGSSRLVRGGMPEAPAEAFDMTTFRTTHPARAPYVFSVHAFASAFGLSPADHIENWPKSDAAEDVMARAFASIYRARDEWRQPELFASGSDDETTGYREASAEEMADAV